MIIAWQILKARIQHFLMRFTGDKVIVELDMHWENGRSSIRPTDPALKVRWIYTGDYKEELFIGDDGRIYQRHVGVKGKSDAEIMLNSGSILVDQVYTDCAFQIDVEEGGRPPLAVACEFVNCTFDPPDTMEAMRCVFDGGMGTIVPASALSRG